MPHPPRRQRPWIPLPPEQEDALRQSVFALIDTAVELPFPPTRREALKIALFQWTEKGGMEGRKSHPSTGVARPSRTATLSANTNTSCHESG